LAQSVRGLYTAEAMRLLGERVALAQAPQITIHPSGWNWLPWLPMRVHWTIAALTP